MTNNTFIQELSSKTNVPADVTQALVGSLIDVFNKTFQNGNQINISSFGFFEVVQQKEKVVLDAKTGEKTLFPPKLMLNFKPANQLKK